VRTEGLAEDASAGYGASANVPQVPQVHQSCVRTELSAVVYDLSAIVYCI
jgi:hypothetical protein